MIGGKTILKQVELGNITIEPLSKIQAGPNSYDLRLGNDLARVVTNDTYLCDRVINTRKPSQIERQMPLENGSFLLLPNQFYLGHTQEIVGSKYYVPILHGRSTAARHGLTVHLSAGFADLGWTGQWVLEIYNYTPWPMMVWPGDRVCQVEFERAEGDYDLYNSTYQGQTGIVPAKGLGDE